MITALPPPLPCEGKNNETSDGDADTVSTDTDDTPSTMEKQLSASSSLSEAAAPASSTPATPQYRRSIFSSYWQRHASSSSIKEDDAGGGSVGRVGEAKRSPVLGPSYLGIYSFAPSPPLMLSPSQPAMSPISSTDSLTPQSLRPKSILRRHRSLQPRHSSSGGTPSTTTTIGPETGDTKVQFSIIAPPPFSDDMCVTLDSSGRSELSKESSSVCSREEPELSRQHSFVHFDPTITVRECVREDDEHDSSNWFNEEELQTFMIDTINLAHHSAVDAVRTYSLPAVKKAYKTAHEAGVKSPIISSNHSEYRALFADPVLHAGDEDIIVHDGSKSFFKLMSKEMKRVLIVDSSPTTLKLFQRHILSIFPHVQIDTSLSGEDALDKVKADSSGLNYDLIIVEERLQKCRSPVCADMKESLLDLTGSELLRLINEMESSTSSKHNGIKHTKARKSPSSRQSLKIGVSVSLGEDCESLRKGGADLFWSKPPPKPSNGLRNQMINALLSKRGKPVFVCGC